MQTIRPHRRATLALLLLPHGVEPHAARVLVARSLRAFGDGFVAVLLPAYLLALGMGQLEVGLISTVTLMGSAVGTLAVGAFGHRFAQRTLFAAAAAMMVASGAGFATLGSFWPLAIIAFFGTINPSSGDVSVFLPLEHARLAAASDEQSRAALFARYSLAGYLFGALGALAAVVPDWAARATTLEPLDSIRLMFAGYALLGLAVWWLYRGRGAVPAVPDPPRAPLRESRSIVVRLAALFSVDSFAGGLVVQSLMALWLFERFGMSLAQAGTFFFFTGLLSAASQLAAPLIARRIGLLNTMVFTHIPANVFLILAAFAPGLPSALILLLCRSALSQMDVPTRSAYVMAVVAPGERAAAASFTAVPRSLASAASPALAGAMFAAGALSAPLVACGGLKIAYDVALYLSFRKVQSGSARVSDPPDRAGERG
ncbi:MAG TPA: MFS transporter [Burkholderiaceae bacterium]|nr:MFS transporter [Burkholderiaceae bacterium]